MKEIENLVEEKTKESSDMNKFVREGELPKIGMWTSRKTHEGGEKKSGKCSWFLTYDQRWAPKFPLLSETAVQGILPLFYDISFPRLLSEALQLLSKPSFPPLTFKFSNTVVKANLSEGHKNGESHHNGRKCEPIANCREFRSHDRGGEASTVVRAEKMVLSPFFSGPLSLRNGR